MKVADVLGVLLFLLIISTVVRVFVIFFFFFATFIFTFFDACFRFDINFDFFDDAIITGGDGTIFFNLDIERYNNF